MTFDFTEIQYQGKTIAQAEADWPAQFNDLRGQCCRHADRRVAHPRLRRRGVEHHYQFADRLALFHADVHLHHPHAYDAGYEFVTLEDLAARVAEASPIPPSPRRSTATSSADGPSPHAGDFALDVTGQGSQVIENVANWYAYDSNSIFLPGTAATSRSRSAPRRTLSRTSPSLPMRGDLLSVTGDGLNLSFSMIGDGQVAHRPWNYGNKTPVVTGATIIKFAGK